MTYTDKQLLDMASKLPSFRGFPQGYWILGVRSSKDQPDTFDDKFYIFKDKKFVKATTGTTNPGQYGLKNFKDYTSQGCAVMKSDEWYYDLWTPGKHKGKMNALVQVSPCKYFRDSNLDLRCDESGPVREGIIGLNFHTATYMPASAAEKFIAKMIGKWSVGCQVANSASDYYRILDYVWKQKRISYCLIKQF
jgi:hypothetical protein